MSLSTNSTPAIDPTLAKWYAEFREEAQQICAQQERDRGHPILAAVLTREQLAALHARETWAYNEAARHWPKMAGNGVMKRTSEQREAEALPYRDARDEQFAMRRHINNIKHALDPQRYVESNGIAGGSPPPPPTRPDNPRDDRERGPHHDYGHGR